MSTPVEVLDTPVCELGEGPVWHADENAVYWTDIHASVLHRRETGTRRVTSTTMPDRLASFAFREGGGFLAAFAGGLALCDHPSAEPVWQHRLANPSGRLRFNDGRVGPDGRFLVGSMDERCEEPLGALWSFGPEGGPEDPARLLVSGVCISNGLCWSPDGGTLYFADSVQRRIDRYAYDLRTGCLGTRSVLRDVSDQPGVPDGAAVDREGGIWSAFYGGGRIVRLLADGTLDRIVELPAKQPTSCAFGGGDLRTLYVTTAAEGLGTARTSTDGRLLALDVGLGGLMPFAAKL